MKPRVKFAKWKDPVAPLLSKAQSKREDEEEVPWDGEAYRPRISGGHLGPCIIGPMGIIPINESNLPGKLFKLFMGHTNFVITPADVDAIKNVVGVEALDPFTPYRFRVAVGRLFRPSGVLTNIRKVLCEGRSTPAQEPNISG